MMTRSYKARWNSKRKMTKKGKARRTTKARKTGARRTTKARKTMTRRKMGKKMMGRKMGKKTMGRKTGKKSMNKGAKRTFKFSAFKKSRTYRFTSRRKAA